MGPRSVLDRLARAYGVEPSYVDMEGRAQEATPDALIAGLAALGAPVQRLEDAPAALRARTEEQWRRFSPPVVVAWTDQAPTLGLRLPAGTSGRVQAHLELEQGATQSWEAPWSELAVEASAELGRARYELRRLPLPEDLPLGYHRLRLAAGPTRAEALVISAPRQAHFPPALDRSWGLFCPLYALRSDRSWGVGDLGDWRGLTRWAAGLGARVVATTPLLATFLDGPLEPSPYSPVSRLFWNELSLDLSDFSEAQAAAVRSVSETPEVQRALEELRRAPLIDYPRVLALKRRALRAAADRFFGTDSPGRADFERYRSAHPEVDDYARFRAATEALGPWPTWPEPLISGPIPNGAFDPSVARYHAFVQWLAEEQVAATAREARARGVHLCFDLPLGAHPEGYDGWRHRDLFAAGARAGAPPDLAFRHGQDWGFSPVHPEQARASHHQYFIASVRHQLRHAGLLRIDHVLGLHRLFWVPKGSSPREGVYVRYPWEELYAVLCLESHRAGAGIVGEDLGTVPPEVRTAMREHGLLRTYVYQLDVLESGPAAGQEIPAQAVASLNTHDLPPFARFWRDQGTAGPAQRRRSVASALEDHLRLLARSPAAIVLVNLEDLWYETEPQNVPGTRGGSNWRRRLRHGLEELPRFERPLRQLAAIRSGQANRPQPQPAPVPGLADARATDGNRFGGQP